MNKMNDPLRIEGDDVNNAEPVLTEVMQRMSAAHGVSPSAQRDYGTPGRLTALPRGEADLNALNNDAYEYLIAAMTAAQDGTAPFKNLPGMEDMRTEYRRLYNQRGMYAPSDRNPARAHEDLLKYYAAVLPLTDQLVRVMAHANDAVVALEHSPQDPEAAFAEHAPLTTAPGDEPKYRIRFPGTDVACLVTNRQMHGIQGCLMDKPESAQDNQDNMDGLSVFARPVAMFDYLAKAGAELDWLADNRVIQETLLTWGRSQGIPEETIAAGLTGRALNEAAARDFALALKAIDALPEETGPSALRAQALSAFLNDSGPLETDAGMAQGLAQAGHLDDLRPFFEAPAMAGLLTVGAAIADRPALMDPAPAPAPLSMQEEFMQGLRIGRLPFAQAGDNLAASWDRIYTGLKTVNDYIHARSGLDMTRGTPQDQSLMNAQRSMAVLLNTRNDARLQDPEEFSIWRGELAKVYAHLDDVAGTAAAVAAQARLDLKRVKKLKNPDADRLAALENEVQTLQDAGPAIAAFRKSGNAFMRTQALLNKAYREEGGALYNNLVDYIGKRAGYEEPYRSRLARHILSSIETHPQALNLIKGLRFFVGPENFSLPKATGGEYRTVRSAVKNLLSSADSRFRLPGYIARADEKTAAGLIAQYRAEDRKVFQALDRIAAVSSAFDARVEGNRKAGQDAQAAEERASRQKAVQNLYAAAGKESTAKTKAAKAAKKQAGRQEAALLAAGLAERKTRKKALRGAYKAAAAEKKAKAKAARKQPKERIEPTLGKSGTDAAQDLPAFITGRTRTPSDPSAVTLDPAKVRAANLKVDRPMKEYLAQARGESGTDNGLEGELPKFLIRHGKDIEKAAGDAPRDQKRLREKAAALKTKTVQVGDKIGAAMAAYFLNAPEGLKESSHVWRENLPVAGIRFATMGLTTAASVTGLTTSVGGSLVAIVGTLGLGTFAAPLVGGVILGGGLGWLSSRVVRHYYNMRRQDPSLTGLKVYTNGAEARKALRAQKADKKAARALGREHDKKRKAAEKDNLRVDHENWSRLRVNYEYRKNVLRDAAAAAIPALMKPVRAASVLRTAEGRKRAWQKTRDIATGDIGRNILIGAGVSLAMRLAGMAFTPVDLSHVVQDLQNKAGNLFADHHPAATTALPPGGSQAPSVTQAPPPAVEKAVPPAVETTASPPASVETPAPASEPQHLPFDKGLLYGLPFPGQADLNTPFGIPPQADGAYNWPQNLPLIDPKNPLGHWQITPDTLPPPPAPAETAAAAVAANAGIPDFINTDGMKKVVAFWQDQLANKKVPGHLRGTIARAIADAQKGNLTQATALMDGASEGGWFVKGRFVDIRGIAPNAGLVLESKKELVSRFAASADPKIRWNVEHAQKFLGDLEARAQKIQAPKP